MSYRRKLVERVGDYLTLGLTFQGPSGISSTIRLHDGRAEAQGQHYAGDATASGVIRRL